MTRANRRLGVLVVVLALVGLLSSVGFDGEGPARSSAAPDAAPHFAAVSIDAVNPSIVTTSTGQTVTVSGTVVNSSDRDLRSLGIRLQRGERVATAADLRRSLADDAAKFDKTGPFVSLSGTLKPRQRKSFSLSMRLSGPGSLDIDATGVYPLLVNLNAVPDYGGQARVGDSRTLLPVLSLPPSPQRASPSNSASPDTAEDLSSSSIAADGSVPADLRSPSALTLLWPIAAPPQLIPGRLGGTGVSLSSDDLGRSLSPGGRLRSIVDSLTEVVGKSDDAPEPSKSGDSAAPSSTATDARPPASKLRQSLCLAVDPDLVTTVRAMTNGYTVTTDPHNPDAPTVPGTAVDAARNWLRDLQHAASQLCVVALPFAGVDLDALAAVGNDALTSGAVASSADLVDDVLGVKSVRGLNIPSVGAITSTGASVLGANKIGSAVTSTSSIAGTSDPSGRYRVGGLGAQTYDAPITAALGAAGSHPLTPVLTPQDQHVSLGAESEGSRRQAAIAALAYPAIAVPATSDGVAAVPTKPIAGRSQFLLPPAFWSPTVGDAKAFLSATTLLLESGVANPTPLASVVNDLPNAAQSARLVPPPGTMLATNRGWLPSESVSYDISADATLSWQMQASFVNSADVDASPQTYVVPLRGDLLRGLRSPNQDTAVDRTALRAERTQRVNAVSSTLERMRTSVTLLDPGGRYTLVSERSPLLLVARNDLDLPIRVRVDTIAPDELSIGDIGVIEIPARGTRQIQLPTRAQTSESMSVQITLVTSTGVSVGAPVSMSVNSNAYGKPLFIVTLAAGVLLVLLVIRRLWHRFRGQPDPADADRPEADETARALASTAYERRVEQEAQRDAQLERDTDGGDHTVGDQPADDQAADDHTAEGERP